MQEVKNEGFEYKLQYNISNVYAIFYNMSYPSGHVICNLKGRYLS